MRKVKKTSFTSENQPKKAKGGKRGPGRPPKPKDPTLLQRIYDGIDDLEGGLTIIVENPLPGMKPGVRRYGS